MACNALLKRTAILAVSASMLLSPVAASAQSAQSSVNAARVDPLVAFSLLGTPDSRMALCGLQGSHDATAAAVSAATASTTTTAATTTTAQADGMSGCVLPMRDAIALPAEAAAAPGAAGVPTAMLFALGGALAWIAVILSNNHDGVIDIRPPVSPA